MAYDDNSGGQGGNYYPDSGEDAAPKDSAEEAPPEKDESKDDETMEGETALLTNSWFAGKDFKVGDEFVGKIVAKHDGETEVMYAPAKPKDDEGTESEPGMDNKGNTRMAAMGQ